MNQLDSFALDMRLLLGLLVFLGLLLILVVAAWTGAKIWIHHAKLKQERREGFKRTHDRHGRPLPPTAEGICEQCQTPSDKVYHLPSGRRLCAACYESQHEP